MAGYVGRWLTPAWVGGPASMGGCSGVIEGGYFANGPSGWPLPATTGVDGDPTWYAPHHVVARVQWSAS
jgi:hypothetical protein